MIKIVPGTRGYRNALYIAATNIPLEVGAGIKSVGAFNYQDQIYIFEISMKRQFFDTPIRNI